MKIGVRLHDFGKSTALELAKKAYEFGIDAIIVQDIGLATKLIELLPDLPIHRKYSNDYSQFKWCFNPARIRI